ncbi:MAG: hypothetical protein JW751_05885 [Polyangiaceae bacterium]|nr:hypothetical protein [Polyangiaceae bacterium]
MRRTNLLACDEGESFLVTADGATLLVNTGDDEQPLWKTECGGKILGIGVTDEEVITLDDVGLLTWWDGESGQRSDEVDVEGTPKSVAVDRDGVAAVLTNDGVKIIDPGDEPRSIAVEGARAVAWAAAGDRIGVGCRDAKLRIFDESDLEEVAVVDLPGAVSAVCALAGGGWAVCVGSAVHVVPSDESPPGLLVELEGTDQDRPKPDCPVGSADGALVAVRAAADRVLVFARNTKKEVASVVFSDRQVAGVAFGARNWLAVAVDGGDAVRVSLRTGAVRHTAPHPERDHRPASPAVAVRKIDRREREIRPAASVAAPTRTRKAPIARKESDVPAPDVQTLGMLGVVALSTLVMWGAAKFACNAHPPESKKPREVGTVELASTPKDAAIELVQRLASHEYDRAAELADTEPAQEIEKQMRQCESNGKASCDARRSKVAGKVLTTAELLTITNSAARARVTTTGPEGTRVYAVELVNAPPIWKVTRLTLEKG